MNKEAATVAAAPELPSAASRRAHRRRTGSLTRRMIGVAAIWIAALLLIGGFALDRVLSRSFVDSFDNQLVYMLNSMVDASEIGPSARCASAARPPTSASSSPIRVFIIRSRTFRLIHAGCRWNPRFAIRRARCGTGDCACRTSHFDIKPHLYDSDEFSSDRYARRTLRDRGARRHPAGLERPLAVPGRGIARLARSSRSIRPG